MNAQITLSARKFTSRRIASLAAFSIVGSIVASSVVVSNANAATPTPAEGVACETLGARAAGTALDCVTTPTGQTWRTKGTRLNPYRIGETATIERFVGAKWIPSYTVKVTGGKPDATADVTFVPTKKPLLIPTGSRATSAAVVITLLGPAAKPAPSAGLESVFVDAADVSYPLYAAKKAEQDCSMAFRNLANPANLAQNRGTITGNVCTYVNASAINSTLLMRIKPATNARAQAGRETWFEFLPRSSGVIPPVVAEDPVPVESVTPVP